MCLLERDLGPVQLAETQVEVAALRKRESAGVDAATLLRQLECTRGQRSRFLGAKLCDVALGECSRRLCLEIGAAKMLGKLQRLLHVALVLPHGSLPARDRAADHQTSEAAVRLE